MGSVMRHNRGFTYFLVFSYPATYEEPVSFEEPVSLKETGSYQYSQQDLRGFEPWRSADM